MSHFTLPNHLINADLEKVENTTLKKLAIAFNNHKKNICATYVNAGKQTPLFKGTLEMARDLWDTDTSPSYLLCLMLFLLFWTLICMILVKLTRTDAVFSKTTMVLFLCRNKSSRIRMKLCNNFLFNKKRISRAKNHRRGAPGWAQPTRARPPPGAPKWVVPTWWPRRPQP